MLNTLCIGTTSGLTLFLNNQSSHILDNLNIKRVEILNINGNIVDLLIQTNSSFYKVIYNETLFTTTITFLYDNINPITNFHVIGNLVYYGEISSNDNLILNILNYSTLNNDKKIFNIPFDSILEITTFSNNLLLVTRNKFIQYDPNLDVIINTTNLDYFPTCLVTTSINYYIGTTSGNIYIYDSSLLLTNTINVNNNKINDLLFSSGTLYISTINGLFQYTTLLSQLNSIYSKNINITNSDIYQNELNKIVNLTNDNIIFSEDFNRGKISNYSVGNYISNAIQVPEGTAVAGFSWSESGLIGNYESAVATSQSTDLITFSDFTDFSSANSGVYVPGITNLTQAVKFEFQLDVVNTLIDSPVISLFGLTTNVQPIIAEDPFDLKKSETLVVHTSYPQKFFDSSTVITRHDSSFKKQYVVDNTTNLVTDKDVAYGFLYEIKSQTKDLFSRYSKESYNPISLDYTKRNYPITAAPVNNLTFTVLNPSEIFLDWDPAATLLDGTLIPSNVVTRYKIYRKDDSNSSYKIIYADGLISLNKTYITSTEPIVNDIGQLVDGVNEVTNWDLDSTLIFDDSVDITFNLDTVYSVDKLILSFVRGYEPESITVQIINGSDESEIFTFNNLDFSLDTEDTTSVTISNIGLPGDLVKIGFILNTNINLLKILECEIYRGLSTSQSDSFYRDRDIDFQNGSQYYYRVISELNTTVPATQTVRKLE